MGQEDTSAFRVLLFKRADATGLERFQRRSRRRAAVRSWIINEQTRVMMPTLPPFAGFPASTLSEQLKLAEIFSLQASMTPGELTHTGQGPLSLLQSKMSDEEERRKRRREKNKVAAARCRNKKKERTDFLQKESERLEVVNSELKSQIEELKQERQRLVHMLNLHRPTCIVRRDSIQTPDSEQNPLLEQISAL